jgi:2-oxo-4-hydroxy-4-carboxy-5-ureidoimidazoline decarboxylase
MMVTIKEINDMDMERFVQVLGPIFEHSPWVAERAFAERPFESVRHLHAVMMKQVTEAESQTILALFRAHPDLATRLRVTDYSAGEQQGAGLNRLSPEEFSEFAALNRTYTEKFGFPFILAVAGKSKEEIAASMEERVKNDALTEWARAIAEISRITEIRLSKTIRG